jgi:hypothetical protein
MSALVWSFDEQYIQGMADLLDPLACLKLGNERRKEGEGQPI